MSVSNNLFSSPQESSGNHNLVVYELCVFLSFKNSEQVILCIICTSIHIKHTSMAVRVITY